MLAQRGVRPNTVRRTSIGGLVGGAFTPDELDRLEQ
jgi:hypothetical protein